MRLLVLLLAALPAFAWNGTGHRVIAAFAYDALSPQVRERVDDLLRRHPDYQRFLRDAPRDSAGRARAAFIAASTWADEIRNDPRFTNEQRHGNWHYINLPFSPDGTPTRPAPEPNAVTEIRRLSRNIDAEGLVWLIHLVGDLHNPLHAVARFTRTDPDGDRGGNDVYVQPGRTLHGFWDGLPGPDPSGAAYVDRLAMDLRKVAVDSGAELDPEAWARAGIETAKSTTYSFGEGSGRPDRPIRLSRAYQDAAKLQSRYNLAAAGRRLAVLLTTRLR